MSPQDARRPREPIAVAATGFDLGPTRGEDHFTGEGGEDTLDPDLVFDISIAADIDLGDLVALDLDPDPDLSSELVDGEIP